MIRSFLRFLFAPGARVIEIEDDFAARLDESLAARRAKRLARADAARKGWDTRRAKGRRAA